MGTSLSFTETLTLKRLKNTPFGAAHTYIAYIRDCPRDEQRVAAYAGETKKEYTLIHK